MQDKSLEQWRFEIKSIGKKHWNVFYTAFLNAGISNFPRFYKALNLYGDWVVFEAVLAASNQEVTGDPLNYVLKVAHNLWKERQLELEQGQEYQKEINTAVEISQSDNSRLAKKLKALEAHIANSTI